MASREDLLMRAGDRLERTCLLTGKRLYQGVKNLLRGRGTPPVSFVAGVQRSGTNMLMNVLERSFVTEVIHERDRRAFDRYQMRDAGRIRALLESSRAEHFIIKSLCELQDLTRLMDEFAPARTIWIVRDYNDVVNSMCASFSNQSRLVNRIAENRDNGGWQGKGMSDATHERIKSVMHENISDTSAAALMWYYRNQLFFEQGFDRDPRVLLVRYESLVTQPEPEFRRIFMFLGIGYRPWHSRKVVAHSIRKARIPEIEPPVRALCDGMTEQFDRLCAGAGVSSR